MMRQEEQVSHSEAGGVGPVQGVGNSACWSRYRETKLEGEEENPKPKSQFKKNPLEQSPNVTKHGEATESEAVLYGADS